MAADVAEESALPANVGEYDVLLLMNQLNSDTPWRLDASHFNYQGTYPCPVCHTGKISSLPLMEAFACSFCQQIFTANLEEQQLKMPSRQPPLIWSWNGKNWKGAQLEGMELSWGYWLAAVALVVLPTAVIGLPAYSLHPSPGTPLFWVPIVWTGLTFLSHLGIIGWLMIEIFQFPLGAYFRAMQRYFLSLSMNSTHRRARL